MPDADVYVLSYPKAGRTWLRALLGACLVEHRGLPDHLMLDTPALFASAGLPRVAFHHDRAGMVEALAASELPRDKSAYRSRKVVLISRDPRDVVVSAYFQATRRIGVFDGDLSSFVRSERLGIDKILTFYGIWHASRHVPAELLFVRYEDLQSDAGAVLRSVLALIGVHGVTGEAIASAIERCSFARLRQAEAEGRFDDFKLRPGMRDDPESYKMRQGKSGNFAAYLSDDDIRYVDARLAALGTPFALAWDAAG